MTRGRVRRAGARAAVGLGLGLGLVCGAGVAWGQQQAGGVRSSRSALERARECLRSGDNACVLEVLRASGRGGGGSESGILDVRYASPEGHEREALYIELQLGIARARQARDGAEAARLEAQVRALEASGMIVRPESEALRAARERMRANDPRGAIRALAGHAEGEEEIAVLVALYRGVGDANGARREMRRYLQRYGDGRHAVEYREQLGRERSRREPR